MRIASRRCLAWIAVWFAAVFGAANAFYLASEWPSIKPKLALLKQRIVETDLTYTRTLDEIAAHVERLAFVSDTHKMDYLRTWVNQNSIDKIDDEHRECNAKVHKIVPLLWKKHSGAGPPPQLACGSRAYALKAILQRLGIRSRIVDLYRYPRPQAESPLESHTFVEAWNSQKSAWEIHDPDLDVSYVHVATGRRASLFQMVMGNIDEFVPINRNGQGWYHLGLQENKAFFALAAYRMNYDGEKPVMLVNDNRIERELKSARGEIDLDVVRDIRLKFADPIIIDTGGLAVRR